MIAPHPPRTVYAPPWQRRLEERRLVVAGADGFIGSHVVRSALSAGAVVDGLCVKRPWRLADITTAGLALETFDGPWWAPRALAQLRPRLQQADALILLLYEPPPPDSDRDRHEQRVNRDGAVTVSALATAVGVRVVYASTADVYGPTHRGAAAEDARLNPMTPYARAKLETEQEIAATAGTCVRIATVYGPGENGPRAIPSFIRAFLRRRPATVDGDGSDQRDYVHVADVAAALVSVAGLETAPPKLNVGSGQGRSTREVLETVAAAMDVAVDVVSRPSARPPSNLVLDSSRAAELFGYAPRADFEVGVAEEAAWLAESLQALETLEALSSR